MNYKAVVVLIVSKIEWVNDDDSIVLIGVSFFFLLLPFYH